MIKGFSGVTLLDFPDTISSIIFIGGCNFRCPICHNPELVLPELLKEFPDIDKKDIFMEIKKRKGFIDGIVISGGEPLLYDETIILAKEIKDIGLKVKIDTNGSFPERLLRILPYVDYISMDIKSSIEKYNEAAGIEVDINKILKSIEIVKGFRDYEFRTTVHPKYVDKDDILKIIELIKGAKRYRIQNARGYKNIKNDTKERLYTDKEFEELKGVVEEFFPN